MSNPLSKPTYIYKRFRVKRASDGGSTTVSVDPVLVVKAVQTLGSLAVVSRTVREAAAAYDPSAPGAARNRSAHVARVLETIVKGKDQGGANIPADAEAGVVVEEASAAA